MRHIDEARAFEAWLATNGRWGEMLYFLAQFPGQDRPEKWYGVKNMEDGRKRYICRVCDCRIFVASPLKKLPPIKALAAHEDQHMKELRGLLDITRRR